ncbi:MAG: protocatechuate 3,4-dioxygenase [Hyphomicrobiaceae bacterium]
MPHDQRLKPTPGQILGPYYPPEPDPEADADLTRWPGAEEAASGPTIALRGRILSVQGAPVDGALVELWQCDHNGRYRHPDAPEHELVDPRFEGYGRLVTGPDGTYAFRVLQPVPYPGRAPHVHFKVSARGFEPLITQMYVDGEARNEGDFALNHAGEEKTRLIVALEAIADGTEDWAAHFDIVLGEALP